MTHARKEIERRALEAARLASAIIPDGEVSNFEEPDFKLQTATGIVGIEVTELLPPAGNGSFSSPLAEKSVHEKVVKIPEQEYNRTPGAIPVRVEAYFRNVDGRKFDKRVMARTL